MLALITVKCAKSADDRQTAYAPKPYDKMMVCNLVQDSHVSEAITKLEAKLETLIALVNKTYTLQPKSTGKLRRDFLERFMFITCTLKLSPTEVFLFYLYSHSRVFL